MAQVSDADVLLLWRALRAFRSGGRPACKPHGKSAVSECPLQSSCPRWPTGVDDREAIFEETLEQTEVRRAAWPCSRILDALEPGVNRISAG
jgi:hypothetical protein